MVKPCWRPLVDGDENERNDGLLWYKDLGNHALGKFSMAVVQANSVLEDQSQIESGALSSDNSGPHGTFVGVYDGHGGPEASRFINNNLFCNLKALAAEHQEISESIIKKAFAATEEQFLSLVKKQWLRKPNMASVGSCCLVGIICDGLLYVANVGDSRLVLGTLERSGNQVTTIQLSSEHNANIESVRYELQSLHPNDSQIVVLKHNVWRVKGLIQVSRSIGDAYLKKADFNREPLQPRFRLPQHFQKPILSSEPSVSVHKLRREDRFLIFASDGLWEHLSNQEATDIVQAYPRKGVARRLVKAALCQAAKKREMRYSDLKKIDQGVRRHFHDDITVILIFIDFQLIKSTPYCSLPVPIRGGGGERSSSE